MADLSVRSLEGLLAALPEPAARAVGRGLGALARRPLGIRRAVVESQIAAAFPARDRAWVVDTARACYRHFGEELAALCGGARRIGDALESVLDPHPARERIERARAGERGVVMVTGHIGNWELAGAYLARLGFPVTAVIQPQRGPGGRRVEALHRKLGFEVVYRDVSPRRLLRGLAAGRALALVADQHARRGGARIDFLGRPAWTTLGPARLCIAADVPLFFAALVREGQGYRVLLERIDGAVDGGGVRRRDPLELTRAWSEALERAIRERPAQYYWFHRRWKGAPEEEPAGTRAMGGR